MHTNKKIPLLVEFIGLPGAGKTTLVQSLQPKLSQHGLVVVTKHDLHQWRIFKSRFLNLMLVFKNPIMSIRQIFNLVKFSWSLDEPVGFKRLLTGMLLNYQLHAFTREVKFDVMLLDQGALQNLWSIAAFSTKFDDLSLQKCMADSCEMGAFNVLYINTVATPELSVRRISQRDTNYSRFDLMDAHAQQTIIKNSYYLMTVIFDKLNVLAQKSLFLDANDEVLKKIMLISKKIKEFDR